MNRMLAGAALAAIVIGSAVRADDALPRRGFLGVMVAQPEEGRLVVNRVIPGSTAERLGLAPDDEILEVDGRSIATAAEFVAAVGGRQAGAPIAFVVRRGDERLERRGAVGPFPREETEHSEVRYESVAVGDHRLRTIVTQPRDAAGPRPAVLFV
jgi:membrane-associated protease RseP (regulator of RpoE activity)